MVVENAVYEKCSCPKSVRGQPQIFLYPKPIATHNSSSSTNAVDLALSLPPQQPRSISLFSSNELFGEPGIYPEGSAMQPASGELWSEAESRDALAEITGLEDLALFDDPDLSARCPHAGPRAAFAMLSSTIAAPLVEGFLNRQISVSSIAVGVTRSPGRVVGPVEGGPEVMRVVNDRYRAEHPALMASSIAHDLLWNVGGAGQFEEATLHMVVALVHLQLVAKSPSIAHTGTELARRQNSLAISLLNSRQPGESIIRVIAPDGPGTIPGGASKMQSIDFWSIPFVGGEPAPSPIPTLLPSVLRLATGSSTDLSMSGNYDQSLGEELSSCGLGGALPPTPQLRAMVALGLLDEIMVAAATGIGAAEVSSFFGLDDAFGCFAK
jgi:hypothetical protein